MAAERHEAEGDTESEQGDADRQAHGEHGAESDDEDDDCGDEAVDLALRQLELAEQVAAVLDGDALDGWQGVAVVDDLRAQVLQLHEADVADVELGESDRAVVADELRLVVGTGQRDVALLLGELEDLVHPLDDRRVVHALLGLDDDLRGERLVRVGRHQRVEHLLRLAVGEGEVGPVVGADAIGDGTDADQQGDPRTDDDPSVADACAGKGGQHARYATHALRDRSRGITPRMWRHRSHARVGGRLDGDVPG